MALLLACMQLNTEGCSAPAWSCLENSSTVCPLRSGRMYWNFSLTWCWIQSGPFPQPVDRNKIHFCKYFYQCFFHLFFVWNFYFTSFQSIILYFLLHKNMLFLVISNWRNLHLLWDAITRSWTIAMNPLNWFTDIHFVNQTDPSNEF